MPGRTPKRKDALQTRAALLAAAAEIFARHGFRNGSVRDLCARAGVNLGAVSHHFGSKGSLYKDVLIRAHRELIECEPIPEMAPGQEPEAALRAWIHYALRFLLLRRAVHPYAGRLIAWEIRDPTPALDALVVKVMQPVRRSLERIITALLGEADQPRIRGQCANFVIGLCVFHEQAQELLRRFGYPVPRTETESKPLADAITEFALGGIDRIAKAARRE